MKVEASGSTDQGRDPVVEAYKQGLDRTLLRENLKRAPTERLENLQALQAFADEVRKAGAKLRSSGLPISAP